MKYDSQSGKILITLSQFVTIARRRLAAAHTPDELEPVISTASTRMLRSVIGEVHGECLTFGFETLGYSFEMSIPVEGVEGGRITVARDIE